MKKWVIKDDDSDFPHSLAVILSPRLTLHSRKMPATPATQQAPLWEGRYMTDEMTPPIKNNVYLIDGEIRTWTGKCETVQTPIYRQSSPDMTAQRVTLGSYGMLSEAESLEALKAATKAYNHGRGVWPKMSSRERIVSLEKFVVGTYDSLHWGLLQY